METIEIANVRNQVELELTNKETVALLVATTFKGLKQEVMKQAIMEGVLRGFTFKDFLQKNIYAISYGNGYSLVTSIDHNRKIGMRSGIVGVEPPEYVTKEGKDGKDEIVSCSVTVKRLVSGHIGNFNGTVFFDEYYKAGTTWDGKYKPSMWDTKPRTMIAKVAEMHALRKACPEELSQSYIEEEMIRETTAVPTYDMESFKLKLSSVADANELKTMWSLLPIEVKQNLTELKDEMKKKFDTKVLLPKETETTADDIIDSLPPDMGGPKA